MVSSAVRAQPGCAGVEESLGRDPPKMIVVGDVEDPVARATRAHHARQPQLGEMLGHGRGLDANVVGEVVDRVLPVQQRPHDPQPGWIREHAQHADRPLDLPVRGINWLRGHVDSLPDTMRPLQPPAERVRRGWLTGLVVIVTLMAAAPPVLAHGEVGVMRIQALRSVGPLRVYVETGVLHTDNDLATDAEVSATLTGPDDATVGPVPLPRISGARYGAEIEVSTPGTWTVAFTSAAPTATATGAVTVPEPSPTSTATAAPTTTTTTTTTDNGEGTSGAVVIGLIVAMGLAVLVTLWRRS